MNEAFREARGRTGPRRPLSPTAAPGPAPDHYVGQLGEAIEETTRLLKERYLAQRLDLLMREQKKKSNKHCRYLNPRLSPCPGSR